MGRYNHECDVWSIGVIIYYMLSGQPPFTGRSFEKLMENITSAAVKFTDPIWENTSVVA